MKYANIISLAAIALVTWTCQTEFPVNVPPVMQMPADLEAVPQQAKSRMEGVFVTTTGQENFGGDAVVKWSGKYLSIFTQVNYLTFETGTKDSVLYFRGYWRVPTSDSFGQVDMMIAKEDGAAALLKGKTPPRLVIKGRFGRGDAALSSDLVFTYERPFSAAATSKKFYAVGHRAGGRTSDRLPVSENSVAMIGYAGRLGANGIEIDIQFTADGVPIVYHDSDINIRLTQKSPLNGPVESFTWEQLRTFVRLIRGEPIPRLEEALKYTIDSTEIQFVWLDIKDPRLVPAIRPIQKAAYEYAASKGRTVEMLMGVPSDEVRQALEALADYKNVPSLCEISPEAVRDLNARAWGPRWTLGTQNEQVASLQNDGHIALCWTIDVPAYIKQFIQEGRFDGLLTNYPSYVTYYYYIQP